MNIKSWLNKLVGRNENAVIDLNDASKDSEEVVGEPRSVVHQADPEENVFLTKDQLIRLYQGPVKSIRTFVDETLERAEQMELDGSARALFVALELEARIADSFRLDSRDIGAGKGYNELHDVSQDLLDVISLTEEIAYAHRAFCEKYSCEEHCLAITALYDNDSEGLVLHLIKEGVMFYAGYPAGSKDRFDDSVEGVHVCGVHRMGVTSTMEETLHVPVFEKGDTVEGVMDQVDSDDVSFKDTFPQQDEAKSDTVYDIRTYLERRVRPSERGGAQGVRHLEVALERLLENLPEEEKVKVKEANTRIQQVLADDSELLDFIIELVKYKAKTTAEVGEVQDEAAGTFVNGQSELLARAWSWFRESGINGKENYLRHQDFFRMVGELVRDNNWEELGRLESIGFTIGNNVAAGLATVTVNNTTVSVDLVELGEDNVVKE